MSAKRGRPAGLEAVLDEIGMELQSLAFENVEGEVVSLELRRLGRDLCDAARLARSHGRVCGHGRAA